MGVHIKIFFVLFMFIWENQTLRADICNPSLSRRLQLMTPEELEPRVCKGELGVTYNLKLNTSLEYIFEYTKEKDFYAQPARVTVESGDANRTYPIIIVVQQQKSVLSWQLPLIVESQSYMFEYNRTSRTLCQDYDSKNDSVDQENDLIVISVSTRSPYSQSFSLTVTSEIGFIVEMSQQRTVTVSPSEPRFFNFQFPEKHSSALLHVESSDFVCMSLSIQNLSCPVFDLERTIQYRGLWETVSSKGGIFLTKQQFPIGLYIAFVVHSTDEACLGKPTFTENRNKTFTFILERSLGYEEYWVAVLAVLAVFVFIYIIAGAMLIYFTKKEPPLLLSPLDENSCCCDNFDSSLAASSNIKSSESDGDSSLDETDIDMLHDADTKDILRTKPFLFVSDLARKEPRILRAKSNLYFWNLLTVAVFYALPVVQLVITYQQVLNQSGNQDLCYYNFLCSHRFGFLSDFNHIFSNIGYWLLGLLFVMLTYRRERLHNQNKNLGIPQHYGLYYAMGVALMMEGVLSACYHLCPNHSNFQFDTSFMYVLSMLSMLKIYQTRHPDINASAYSTFGVLAGVIFLGMCGVLNGSAAFYVGFTILHVLTCFALTAQIYYMGRWKLDMGVFKRVALVFMADFKAGPRHWCRPMYPSRMVLLLLGNVCNWGLVAAGYMLHMGDFATYLLSIFMGNLMLYFTFYILMKLISRERILFQPLMYIVLSGMSWSAALYFFYNKSISWKLTPAQSRTYNQPCELLSFYDKHDIWHFLSAGSMFFSFMVLLTLDDDLADKDRSTIPVF